MDYIQGFGNTTPALLDGAPPPYSAQWPILKWSVMRSSSWLRYTADMAKQQWAYRLGIGPEEVIRSAAHP